MRRLDTEIHIPAPPDVVWDALTDFASLPEWSSFIECIAGEPRVGARLQVTLRPPGGRPTTVRPRVMVATPGEELRWRGSLGVPGLFSGEHRFVLHADGDSTRFEHGESFKGMLVPMVWRSIGESTEAGFHAFNDALRRRATAGRS